MIILLIVLISNCSNKKNGATQDSTVEQTYVANNANNNISAEHTQDDNEGADTSPDGIPLPSEENDLLKIVENSSAEYYAYLTFDDGPTIEVTPKILDVLRKYNIKATFFQVGSRMKQYPDTARRVYEEGHLIASHSNSHDYDEIYATESGFKQEFNDSYERICDVTGEETFKLMRFPGGSYNAGSYASSKQKYKETLKDMDFYYIDWNTLTGDAEGSKPKNAQEQLEYLKENMPAKGTNIVVLMHDAANKAATAEALPSIIEYLASEGYSFHRLDDIPY